MRTIEIGLVLPMGESFVDGATARWVEIRELARRAEEIGFDTVPLGSAGRRGVGIFRLLGLGGALSLVTVTPCSLPTNTAGGPIIGPARCHAQAVRLSSRNHQAAVRQ